MARRNRTKLRILEAHSDLLRQGHLRPTAAEVAEQAQVSIRTLWTVFGDMEGLFRATTDYWFANDDALRRPIDAEAPLLDRIKDFCAERSRRLESIHPAASAAVTLEHGSLALRESRAGHVQRVIDDVDAVFSVELLNADGEVDSALRDAMLATTSWHFWNMLCGDLGRTTAEAEAAMVRALTLLLVP